MRPLAVPLTLCALLAGACGDGGDRPAAPPRSVAAGEHLRVVGDEYSFDPERVVVRAAGRLVITLDNRGALAHNLKLVRGGELVGGTPTSLAGDSASDAVSLRPGGYEMVCTVGDHAELGMVGELRVKE